MLYCCGLLSFCGVELWRFCCIAGSELRKNKGTENKKNGERVKERHLYTRSKEKREIGCSVSSKLCMKAYCTYQCTPIDVYLHGKYIALFSALFLSGCVSSSPLHNSCCNSYTKYTVVVVTVIYI